MSELAESPEEVLHRRGLSDPPGRFWMGREGSPLH
jgi:hypothetical protein